MSTHVKGLYHWGGMEMSNGFTEAHDEGSAKLLKWVIRSGLVDPPAKEKMP